MPSRRPLPRHSGHTFWPVPGVPAGASSPGFDPVGPTISPAGFGAPRRANLELLAVSELPKHKKKSARPKPGGNRVRR
jgi:hypothetical protein